LRMGFGEKAKLQLIFDQKNFQHVYIGAEIAQADASFQWPFKGHELSGFGGTIKNLGMGCASRKGKLAQHSNLSPAIKRKKMYRVRGLRFTLLSGKRCPWWEKKAVMDTQKCIGCGECILICAQEAIQIQWNQAVPVFMENMVEYTMGF